MNTLFHTCIQFCTAYKDEVQRTSHKVKVYNIGLHHTLKNRKFSIILPLKKKNKNIWPQDKSDSNKDFFSLLVLPFTEKKCHFLKFFWINLQHTPLTKTTSGFLTFYVFLEKGSWPIGTPQ